MHYEGNVIRPPSEAHSIILQVTVGCSHNKCTFCGAYKDVKFKIKDEAIVREDIDFASRYCRRQKRVFLADGDVLILSQRRLITLFKEIREKLPWVNRISLYANAKAILSKSEKQLLELKKLGLHRIYMGLESGDDKVLQTIKKGANAEKMIRAAQHVRQVDIFLSVTVLLGVGGVSGYKKHARETAEVLAAMSPNQIAALTLMVMDNTPLGDLVSSGEFQLPDSRGILLELRELMTALEVGRPCQFQTNHASNYLAVNCRLPKDKEKVLKDIEEALEGSRDLRPEHLRAL
ncbi:MAG: radical SAM protein [Thermodesulfobacteriota bacterium]